MGLGCVTDAAENMRAPVSDEGSTLTEVVEGRVRNLEVWLSQNASYCADEQRHLDEGSRERAYWHYGYATALRDLLNALKRSPKTLN